MKSLNATLNTTKQKRHLQFSNGVESMRTMLLNELHRRVGLCFHCGKVDCAGKDSGSNLPETIRLHVLLAAINDVAEQFGQPRL